MLAELPFHFLQTPIALKITCAVYGFTKVKNADIIGREHDSEFIPINGL